MAIVIEELFGSRETDAANRGSTVVFKYMCYGSDDENALRSALDAYAPVFYNYNGLAWPRQSARLLQVGPEMWEGTVEYGHPEDPESQKHKDTNDTMMSFDTTGGEFHLTESLSQTGYKSPSLTALPDIGNTIGVEDDKVKGVDIIIPQLNFQETHWIPGNLVTVNYVKTVATVTGTCNDRPFRGFAAGELLFLGAQGTLRGQGDWEILYNFAAQQNINAPFFVGDVEVASKKGHEYMWIMYEKDDDDEVTVPKVLAVYVSQVYQLIDFAAKLGI